MNNNILKEIKNIIIPYRSHSNLLFHSIIRIFHFNFFILSQIPLSKNESLIYQWANPNKSIDTTKIILISKYDMYQKTIKIFLNIIIFLFKKHLLLILTIISVIKPN